MLYPIETYYKILDQEERKGNLKHNEAKGINVSFGEAVRDKSKELRAKREELRELKRSLKSKVKDKGNGKQTKQAALQNSRLNKNSIVVQRKIEELNVEISEIKGELSDLKRKETDKLVKGIESGKAQIKLRKTSARGKDVYTYGDLRSLLICKIVMLELRKQYHVYPSNRNEIIEALTSHLQSKISYGIIRTDIKHFFESVPQERLIEKLYEDGKVSPRIMRYIKSSLFEYNRLTNNDEKKGLPRGICFSSYLAEIYLKAFDDAVKSMDGILFYRRYVDDILILTFGKSSPVEINKNVENKINDLGLKFHHDEKSLVKEMYDDANGIVFDYLGYKFNVAYGKTTVGLSTNKFNRYSLLLHKIFEIYSKTKNCYTTKHSSKNPPLKEFLSRIAVLTGNGNLNGRKNFVKTGIYYSNKMLTDESPLEELDKIFSQLLNDRDSFSVPASLFDKDKDYGIQMKQLVMKISDKYGFKSGFEKRRAYNHSNFTTIQEDLKHIYQKYSENR